MRNHGFLLAESGWELSFASRPKRLAYPLILLAAKGFLFPAKIYFQSIYYPMIEWKMASKESWHFGYHKPCSRREVDGSLDLSQ